MIGFLWWQDTSWNLRIQLEEIQLEEIQVDQIQLEKVLLRKTT